MNYDTFKTWTLVAPPSSMLYTTQHTSISSLDHSIGKWGGMCEYVWMGHKVGVGGGIQGPEG